MKIITEGVVWEVLEEALKNEEVGLILWPSWTEWENLSYRLHPKNEIYEFILKKVKNNEVAYITSGYLGLKMTSIIAVPVKAMIVSDKFFENILDICQKGIYHGPITFVNSNEIAECF